MLIFHAWTLTVFLPGYSTSRIVSPVLPLSCTCLKCSPLVHPVPFCLPCAIFVSIYLNTFLYSSPVYYARLWGSRDGQEWPQGSSALTDIDTLSQADSRHFPGISHASLENLQGLPCSLPTILLPFDHLHFRRCLWCTVCTDNFYNRSWSVQGLL